MDGVRLFIAGVLLAAFAMLGLVFLWVLYDQGVFSRSSPRYETRYQDDYQEGGARVRERQTFVTADQYPPPPPRIRRRPIPPPCDMSCY